jgi:hypothetical protein
MLRHIVWSPVSRKLHQPVDRTRSGNPFEAPFFEIVCRLVLSAHSEITASRRLCLLAVENRGNMSVRAQRIDGELAGQRAPVGSSPVELVTAYPTQASESRSVIAGSQRRGRFERDLAVVRICSILFQTDRRVRAIALLQKDGARAYNKVLATLGEETSRRWNESIKPRPIELLMFAERVYTADSDGLIDFLQREVLTSSERKRRELEDRPQIRQQVIGEALEPEKLEGLARYEIHLDRKLERTLTMLIRLQERRDAPA